MGRRYGNFLCNIFFKNIFAVFTTEPRSTKKPTMKVFKFSLLYRFQLFMSILRVGNYIYIYIYIARTAFQEEFTDLLVFKNYVHNWEI